MDLLCISKVSLLFCVFLIGWKIFTRVAADWAVTADVAPMWDIRGKHVAMMWRLTGRYLKRFGRMNLGRWISEERLGSIERFLLQGKQRRGGARRQALAGATPVARPGDG